ncbi:hypothetical protein BGZ61DRAFT_575789 [Ilyonectria robusta]|uniref:uncharacterized protein n=1 Tax=Ilyonectria robusta TaxID=1079257 RepID=UPI001E8E30E8|nr:uncharacterized protein BGZ61DRAFT_575789 [Ilyonectria robusta]KAH8706221.1 hypothetical protein BGZ61DRAFT_575789 [Ilyonectria robusta]
MDQPGLLRREVADSQFRDNTIILQGDVHGNINLPQQPSTASSARPAVRVIPYPRNEDVVPRLDLINRLDTLLPQTSKHCSAVLWGLGGSGKTRIALDYAYRWCDDESCSVYWVHADSEATFEHDYRAIAKQLDIDRTLKGEDLLATVRRRIEAQPKWVLILDNADDLTLFGIGPAAEQKTNLYKYIPSGTVLWTSRDERVVGTLVGPRRGINVARMTSNEAENLLAMTRDEEISEGDAETALLKELQWLPLSISQAGAYMRRTSTTVKEYLHLLAQGRQRWDVLKTTEFDRYRRPDVPNSVLETWSISINRIQQESEMAYRILHVIAYLDNQNIPNEVMEAVIKYDDGDSDDDEDDRIDRELIQAITRLKEYSFIRMRQMKDGNRSYEMHKLVQEATRHGLTVRKPTETGEENMLGVCFPREQNDKYFSSMAIRIVATLFPIPEPEMWLLCEKYIAHAVQVAEWAEICKEQIEVSKLLSSVSEFLHSQRRWRERERVDEWILRLRREVLEEKHPDTIDSMARLVVTYLAQGRYTEAMDIHTNVLEKRREVLGDEDPATIWSMREVALMHGMLGRYNEAELMNLKVLDLRRFVLGERHPDTITSRADVATTYHRQGRYDEAEPIFLQVLDLRWTVLGERNPDTIQSMAELATTYHQQGRYAEAEEISAKVLDLRRELLGDNHPDTLQAMRDLAITWNSRGHRHKALPLLQQSWQLQCSILGPDHPWTKQCEKLLESWG